MKYYPAFLDIKNKKVTIVGGGRVAERKVRSLIEAGARIKLISPELTSGLMKLREKGRISHTKRTYRKGDLKGSYLVIACTSSSETNVNIAHDADCLVNAADSPSAGNFIVPSVVKRGPLTIAVSTEGASPAVSRAIRKEIERHYDKEFSRYLGFLEQVRKKALLQITDRKKRETFLKSLASEEAISVLRNKGFKAISKKILSELSAI